MKTTSPLSLGQYKNKEGEVFELSWWKCCEKAEMNYRMYFVKASHKDWGEKTYTIFVVKQSYPNENDADHLATKYVLEEIKRRLELVEDGKHLLLFNPINSEGWGLI